MTYPDGEVVTHRYDDAGQLLSVTGTGQGWSRTYASELQYNVFGNRVRARFGNGAVTTWKFDKKRVHLEALTSTLASSAPIQDLRYQYDPSGNPIAIDTLLPPPGPSSKLPGGASLTMTYDGVDRLVLAKGTSQLAPQKSTIYEQAFSYSPSHNLLTKKRTHLITQPKAGGVPLAPADTNIDFAYLYAGSRPHAPTRVGDLDIEYDASGNPILRRRSSTGREENLVWDDDGRMVEFRGGSAHQRNTFDASGNRVLRQGANRTTIFSSAFFDLEGSSQGVKHIFAGDTRVASILATYSAPLPTASPLPPAKPGSAFYFHQDHLGSTALLTDDRGDVYQHLEYFPDGQVWIDSGPQQPVNGYLFSGKPFDPDTGFSDFGQRFYDPKTSLFLGVDPAFTSDSSMARGAPIHLAVSAYAAHDPYGVVDPDGRAPRWLKRVGRAAWSAAKIGLAGAAIIAACGATVGAACIVTAVGGSVYAGQALHEGTTGKPQPHVVEWAAGEEAGRLFDAAVVGASGGALAAELTGPILLRSATSTVAVETGGPLRLAESAPTAAAGGGARVYSTAFEARLSSSSYPGVSRPRHFQEANEQLLRAMEGSPEFARQMRGLGINLERTATGLAPRTPPSGWTWHHEVEAGVMRLVPRAQHTPGSSFWDVLHPGGRGGYSTWGQ